MNSKVARALWVGACLLVVGLGGERGLAATAEEGTIQVRAFDLPLSELLSAESRAVLTRRRESRLALGKACPIRNFEEYAAARECYAKHHYPGLIARFRERYAVDINSQTIAGIPTEIITPAEGVPVGNQERVLINLHGGGFVMGDRWEGQIESIPIAAVGKFKVVSVDYRVAPEHRFPAASEDVEAVYRELLKTYKPSSIGIYGCSAGGLLTGQVIAWLQRARLPMPGAVGMFCSAASYWGEGDSGEYATARLGFARSVVMDPQENPYLKGMNPYDPIVFPSRSLRVMAKFPPSLLITATRDWALSSVAHMHSRLVALGVDAQLHVWEGLDHAFLHYADLPESREAFDVAARFFDRHLGKQATPARGALHAPSLDEILATDIDRFVKADQQAAPAPCQVLFVGSSSIVMWKTLAADMAPIPVINRGFGGSHIEHINKWFDRVVAPYQPRAIVFYAGENDLADGKPVEQLVGEFDAFMARKTAVLGQTPVYFISVKPSTSRFWHFKQQTQFNDEIRARVPRRIDLRYIDVATPMLQDGKPKSLFMPDNLHMTPEGYVIWTQQVRSAILPNAEAEARGCRPQ
jgi:epsilon-lactone hydrolase